jgi:hypothetical protein
MCRVGKGAVRPPLPTGLRPRVGIGSTPMPTLQSSYHGCALTARRNDSMAGE